MPVIMANTDNELDDVTVRTLLVQGQEDAPAEPPVTKSQMNHPFVCNICKRSYSRVDHLARHHRSR